MVFRSTYTSSKEVSNFMSIYYKESRVSWRKNTSIWFKLVSFRFSFFSCLELLLIMYSFRSSNLNVFMPLRVSLFNRRCSEFLKSSKILLLMSV